LYNGIRNRFGKSNTWKKSLWVRRSGLEVLQITRRSTQPASNPNGDPNTGRIISILDALVILSRCPSDPGDQSLPELLVRHAFDGRVIVGDLTKSELSKPSTMIVRSLAWSVRLVLSGIDAATSPWRSLRTRLLPEDISLKSEVKVVELIFNLEYGIFWTLSFSALVL
jgi:hypothetical protein